VVGFQCHHSVPASRRVEKREEGHEAVSMPPRRSCFAATRMPCSWGRRVSMPPRRSCFRWWPASPTTRRSAFQCHHGVPASDLQRPVCAPRGQFQCHHGVPASPPDRRVGAARDDVSMPPRRSCFELVEDDGVRVLQGFNATTAFLLPRTSHRRTSCSGGVSMPPRRSCFGNPTGGGRPCSSVSMPPRRSCFHLSDHHCMPMVHRFNATTAFLLPARPRRSRPRPPGFQCHHGVPASRRLRLRAGGPREFQCHHGVPASAPSHRRRIREAQVSMPPRRSCFEGSWTKSESPIRVSMPPRRSCFLPASQVADGVQDLVSMPPRRSCFRPRPPMRWCYTSCFNATTAFLLRVSGPAELPRARAFQCHHGVPASVPILESFLEEA
jgi:hypothetical protein